MNRDVPLYPVDRYLAESSTKYEMVNISNEDIWNSEPVLRPEDEIILRKLHEMLQSTAEDLKLLSGELNKFNEPKVQVKSSRTPLDEEFNEKVHIEEVVNAKFHGYKILDRPDKLKVELSKKVVNTAVPAQEKTRKTQVQANVTPTLNKPTVKRNLGISRTRIVHIDSNINRDSSKEEILRKNQIFESPVQYKEYFFKYSDVKPDDIPKKMLIVQPMPSINIRSELKEQKVLHLDILPDTEKQKESTQNSSNIAVIAIKHENPVIEKPKASKTLDSHRTLIADYCNTKQHASQPIRRVSKMSAGDSSSTNLSNNIRVQSKTKKDIRRKTSPKYSSRGDSANRKRHSNKETNTSNRNIEEWKRKLSSVYGYPSSSRSVKLPYKQKQTIKKSSVGIKNGNKKTPLNNADYIPYSQLTLGGAKVSDIEKELVNAPEKDMPLSPIIDRILSSREHSFHVDSPKKEKQKILTTSDENLLEEILVADKNAGKKILDSEVPEQNNSSTHSEKSSDSQENEDLSYADDFEDEKSNKSNQLKTNENVEKNEGSSSDNNDTNITSDNEHFEEDSEDNNFTGHNKTYTKVSNLTFKNKVDVFEYVHEVGRQDTGTQSMTTQTISLKETQTSPPNEQTTSLQPIHNDLWPTIDPGKQVETMFKLEKEFIKKLIIEEYGDLLSKPSTSKQNCADDEGRNLILLQKNTQTSPARPKSIMTSPTKMKTRTTSPFPLPKTIDSQTSPVIQETNEEEIQVEIEKDVADISVNLSSPRFSLRLPNSTRDVFSNLELKDKVIPENTRRRRIVSSSSSLDPLNSSSEISSLGEVKLKLTNRIRDDIFGSLSECSSTGSSKFSVDGFSSGFPLRSEGELSVGQIRRKKTHKPSDGEMSFGNLS